MIAPLWAYDILGIDATFLREPKNKHENRHKCELSIWCSDTSQLEFVTGLTFLKSKEKGRLWGEDIEGGRTRC